MKLKPRGKAFEKGNRMAANRGPNKITRTVKETVLEVFNKIQGNPKLNMEQFAKDYTRDFYNIAAKLIPTEVQATVDATVNWNEIKIYEAEPETNPGD